MDARKNARRYPAKGGVYSGPAPLWLHPISASFLFSPYCLVRFSGLAMAGSTPSMSASCHMLSPCNSSKILRSASASGPRTISTHGIFKTVAGLAYATLLASGGTVPAGPKPKGERKPRPLKAQTVLHVHRVLHTALEQARKWKLISENPARDATAPSPAKAPARAFTAAEVQRLLAAAAGDRIMTTVVSLLLVTGIRRSELLGLAWDAIDLDAGTITIRRAVIQVRNTPVLREQPKTNAGWRIIGLSAGVVDLLRAQKRMCSKPRWPGARATSANRFSVSPVGPAHPCCRWT